MNRHHIVRVIALACVTASFSSPMAAQQSPAPQPFKAQTDLVEVDVVVQDKNGAFVHDLGIEDFELLEEGKPQRIQQIYLQLTGDQRTTARSSISPDAPESAKAPRIFVMVFDEGHMSPAGFKRTQEAAATFFSERLLPGDLGGVVVNGLMANDRITNDRAELLQAVKDAKPSLIKTSQQVEERQWPRMTEVEAIHIIVNSDAIVLEDVTRRACAEDPDQCRGLDGVVEEYVQSKALHMAEEARGQSMETLQVLRRLMEGLANIEGRKSVLLMAEGFVADATWPLVTETEEAAARASTRIYTLDARGLERADAGGRERNGRTLREMDRTDAESMNSLASDTGGFAVRNALSGALVQISADAGNYYVLGHRPVQLDGEFHKLTVRVKRPGMTVRARSGYVASVAAARSVFGPISGRPVEGVARPVEGIDTPGTPTASDTAPSSSGGLVPIEPNEYGFRARPDAPAHVAALEKNGAANPVATTGWEAFSRGDLDTARNSLTSAPASPSAAAWVYYALGHTQYGLGDHAKAITAWERALAMAPEFEPVYFDLADSYLQHEEFDKASRVLRQATERWPTDGETFLALGVVSAWREAFDEAVGLFEKSIAVSPNNAAAYFNLGKALELRYYGSRRYVDATRTWQANEPDRTRAAAAYERCVALGGPFAADAREGLTRLEWMTK